MQEPHQLPLLASKLLNTPLFILPEKADVLVSLLRDRMGLVWKPGSLGAFQDDIFDNLGDE